MTAQAAADQANWRAYVHSLAVGVSRCRTATGLWVHLAALLTSGSITTNNPLGCAALCCCSCVQTTPSAEQLAGLCSSGRLDVLASIAYEQFEVSINTHDIVALA